MPYGARSRQKLAREHLSVVGSTSLGECERPKRLSVKEIVDLEWPDQEHFYAMVHGVPGADGAPKPSGSAHQT